MTLHDDDIHGGDARAALEAYRERVLAQRRFEEMLRRRAEEDAEVKRRTAIVRAAKDRHPLRYLPDAELDAILPDAVPARRKRVAR